MGAASAVSDHVMKQSSNNKLIRKQSGKRVVLSSSDSLQHNSDSNALPYAGTFMAVPIQMQKAGYCKEREVSLLFHHVTIFMPCDVQLRTFLLQPHSPPGDILTL